MGISGYLPKDYGDRIQSRIRYQYMIQSETQRRLRRRAKNGERTYDDVIIRLLNESSTKITLVEVIETAMNQYDHVASITVDHISTHEDSYYLMIWIYTGEADRLEEPVDLFSQEYQIVIDFGKAEKPLYLDFDVIATYSGPNTMDTGTRTPVYMSDSVIGAPQLDLDAGLAYLNEKLERPDDWESSDLSGGLEEIQERYK